MNRKFETVFLQDGDYVSSWAADVSLETVGGCDEDVIVLPPLPPSALRICIKCYDNDAIFSWKSYDELAASLQKGIAFWENQLLYEVKVIHSEDSSIMLNLRCKVWSIEKMVMLLEKPASLRSHQKLPRVVFLDKLELECRFYHSTEDALLIGLILPQFNEYFSSLIVSQFEFRYPMVFSLVNRQAFQSQSDSLGPLSYSLTNTSSLIPLLVKLVAMDRRATTAYRLLNSSKRVKKGNPPIFQIFK